MAILPQTLNGLRALEARFLFLNRGAWLADVELDPDVIETATALLSSATPAVLVVGDVTFTGTIDPRGSGTFSNKAVARVVGGRGGWDKTVSPLHFYSPVTTSVVYLATGGEVGEIVVDPIPEPIAEHFARVGGPASSVFGNRDWHVDPVTGVTMVAPWLPIPLDPTAIIVDCDISQRRLTISSDTPIFPGTLIADERLGSGLMIARDVEQTFGAKGSTAEVWCSDDEGSRITKTFANAVKHFAGTQYLKAYRYRFVLEMGDLLALQGITEGAPDLNPIEQWTGLSGAKAHLIPGTELVVGFAGDGPTDPYIVSFSPLGTPTLGIELAGGLFPLVVAPWAIALATALTTFAGALSGAPPPIPAAASALQSALAALPLPGTLLVKGT